MLVPAGHVYQLIESPGSDALVCAQLQLAAQFGVWAQQHNKSYDTAEAGHSLQASMRQPCRCCCVCHQSLTRWHCRPMLQGSAFTSTTWRRSSSTTPRATASRHEPLSAEAVQHIPEGRQDSNPKVSFPCRWLSTSSLT